MTIRAILRTAAVATLAAGAGALPAAAAPTFFAGTGHYYEFIAENVSWDTALANAAIAPELTGYDSYLLTITSSAEDDFIKTLTGGATYVWAAGSDRGHEGTWNWVAGPETGLVFWNSGPVVGVYQHWNGGEPNNNNANENVLHVKANAGDWNDIYETFPSGGYVVEYSLTPDAAVPEPASWALMILGFGAAGASLRRRRAVTA